MLTVRLPAVKVNSVFVETPGSANLQIYSMPSSCGVVVDVAVGVLVTVGGRGVCVGGTDVFVGVVVDTGRDTGCRQSASERGGPVYVSLVTLKMSLEWPECPLSAFVLTSRNTYGLVADPVAWQRATLSFSRASACLGSPAPITIYSTSTAMTASTAVRRWVFMLRSFSLMHKVLATWPPGLLFSGSFS